LTVTVIVFSEDWQSAVNAFIVKVVDWAVLDEFIKVPAIEASVPLSGIPLRFILSVLVHWNVVPVMLFGLEISIVLIAVPEQTVWSAEGATVNSGIGLTSTAEVTVVKQPANSAFAVNVIVWGRIVEFVSCPEMVFPVPLSIPLIPPVLVLVQLRIAPVTL